MNYTTFNKLILFSVEQYLSQAIEEGTSTEQLHKDIIAGIRSFMTFGRFSKEEQERLERIGEHDTIQRLKAVEVSYVIYALELLRLWVTQVPREVRRNIHLGVGNKKLMMGKASFAIHLLKLKQQDMDTYKEKKKIIDESVKTARLFFHYMLEELQVETDKPEIQK